MMKKSVILGLAGLMIAVGVSVVASAGDEARRVEVRKIITPCEGDDCPAGDAIRRLFIGADGEHVRLGDGPLKWVHGGGFLGVALTELTPELREHLGVSGDYGVIVSKVMADTPAAKAGIEVGDIITGIDGEGVDSAFALSRKVRGFEAGEAAAIELWRDGRQQTLSVSVEERPAGKNVMAFRCEDGDCEAFGDGEANVFTFNAGGDGHWVRHQDQRVVVLDCDGDDCPEVETFAGDFEFDFDCGQEECNIQVECNDGDCACTVNGDATDCSAIGYELGE